MKRIIVNSLRPRQPRHVINLVTDGSIGVTSSQPPNPSLPHFVGQVTSGVGFVGLCRCPLGKALAPRPGHTGVELFVIKS